MKTVPKYLPVTEGQLAIQGVTINASWKPVIRKLGGLDMALVPAGCFSMGVTDERLEEALVSCDSFYGV